MSAADVLVTAGAIQSARPGSLSDYLATLQPHARQAAAVAIRAETADLIEAADIAAETERETAATRSRVRNLHAVDPHTASLYVLRLAVVPDGDTSRVAACAAAALDELDRIRGERS
jgi:hypothetical protein